ncbi:YesL family protein [Enterococcus songbeiensis]|uniref:YesL family protein n=1 Tax=Enterococcus songbeiensis TaxID=2559927 RepID=UPI0010F78A40|nr:DUF624 domain-containing protein [Enterococcus songbeiensis]
MTLEKINKMNDVLIGILKVAYLNLLWLVFTLLGLFFFGIGPATYAMMKYYDRWLRLKEALPVTKSFWRFYKERFRQSVAISWIYLVLFGILWVNLFSLTQWYLQAANVVILVVVLFSLTHVFTVMAATSFKKIWEVLRGAALLGLGYLHYTIISWTVILGGYVLLARTAPAVVFLFGVGGAGFILGIAGKLILEGFMEPEEVPTEI